MMAAFPSYDDLYPDGDDGTAAAQASPSKRSTHGSMGDMPMLSFRQMYVAPIMRGEKRATIRRASNRLPRQGDDVVLTVGPRPPFAHATVRRVERFTLDDCERWFAVDGHPNAEVMRRAIVDLYGEDAELVVIEFALRRPPRTPRRASTARR
jgi:hypothetical protein